MRIGNMYDAGDVVLAKVQFTDTFEVKIRPAVVLFTTHDNVVVAGITSNTEMKGIPLTKKDGAIKESIIKTNYIFTIATGMISKTLFSLNKEKRKQLHATLVQQLSSLQR